MSTLYILDNASFELLNARRFNNEPETYSSCLHQAYSLKRETNIEQAIAVYGEGGQRQKYVYSCEHAKQFILVL